MELTPEQQASINQWNSLGDMIIDSTMKQFLVPWFTNARMLLKANFPIHTIRELTDKLGKNWKTFTVLGSGPSASVIAKRLPDPHGAILCSPTALGALAREGIRPTAVICADSNPQMYMHLKETKLFRPDTLDVVLPVTADPAWYDKESVLGRDRLFFYLPYLDHMGDVDIGYNHLLKALFPEVKQYITQAGCVANLAFNVADMSCGKSSEKRIYIGVDCSWAKDGPVHSSLRFPVEAYSRDLQLAWKDSEQHAERSPTIDVTWKDEVIQTDLIQIGYAINLFFLMHTYMRDKPFARNRYALIDVASKLYFAVSPSLLMSVVAPEQTASNELFVSLASDKDWAYKVLLDLIALSNKLHDRLRNELIEKIIHDWKEKPEVQNIVHIPFQDFTIVAKAVHTREPSIQLRYNGQDVRMEEKNGKDKNALET